MQTTASFRSTETLPAGLPPGTNRVARIAARVAALRLGAVPPVGQMSLPRLREHVREVHAQHVAAGGRQTIPAELRTYSRAELEDMLRRLKGVRALD